MISHYPAPFFPTNSAAPPKPRADQELRPAPKITGAWHYQAESGRWVWLTVAAISSAALHAVVFFGITPPRELKPHVLADDTPTIELRMPDLKELEEPEPTASEGDETPIDAQAYAPMQADVPQVVTSTDFVQQLDMASLIEKPDLSGAKVFVVPENISHGAIRQSIGQVFNIADLDRPPEPLVQTPPVFPHAYKYEIMRAVVRVQFIVDTTGQVLNAVVVESTHSGFNESALLGVSKWKFRPGIKGGRRVNTRMEVPIVFRVTESE